MKLDTSRIDELITLGHIQIVVDLLFLTRKSFQLGKTVTFQTISELEESTTLGELKTIEQFDSWVQNKGNFKPHAIYQKIQDKASGS